MCPAAALPAPRAGTIDPRGPQFAASLTALVLVAVLLTAPRTAGVVLLALQGVLFAVGVTFGVRRGPWAAIFARLVRPRLAAPAYLEDAAPPRFAQGVGLGFVLVALVGYLGGADVVGAVATGMALTAALLNAVFRLCLGCEIYLLLLRWQPGRSGTARPGSFGAPAPGTDTDPRPNPNEKVTA